MTRRSFFSRFTAVLAALPVVGKVFKPRERYIGYFDFAYKPSWNVAYVLWKKDAKSEWCGSVVDVDGKFLPNQGETKREHVGSRSG